MSTGYKIAEQDGVYYVTFQIVAWVDIFTRKIYRDITIDSLKYCQKTKDWKFLRMLLCQIIYI